MLNLPQITAICIDGRLSRKHIEESAQALRYSTSQVVFGYSKFLCVEDLKIPPPIETNLIKPLTINDYSFFVTKKLNTYVNTPYCLIIQHDGVITNPDKWTNDFLNYDYIGAPWPSNYTGKNSVGNGGFSLRSKKLLQLLASENFSAKHPEDVHVCQHLRCELEKQQIKFAPPCLAALFSIELDTEYGIYGKDQSFGIHLLQNKISVKQQLQIFTKNNPICI